MYRTFLRAAVISLQICSPAPVTPWASDIVTVAMPGLVHLHEIVTKRPCGPHEMFFSWVNVLTCATACALAPCSPPPQTCCSSHEKAITCYPRISVFAMNTHELRRQGSFTTSAMVVIDSIPDDMFAAHRSL